MKVYIEGILHNTSAYDTGNSFAQLLSSAVAYYHDRGLSGQQMLITFSEEEEKEICNKSRELLETGDEADAGDEQLLLARALKAMISATVRTDSSLETITLCTYIQSIAGTAQRRRLGILYHYFQGLHHVEAEAATFCIYAIEMTMTV